jgi:hypothetical protein
MKKKTLVGRQVLEQEVDYMRDYLVISNFMEGGLEEA